MNGVDFFGQTYTVGDSIAYPVGRGGARLVAATVEAIVPLVPHRDGTSCMMRADQVSAQFATRFFITSNQRHYVVKVRQPGRRDKTKVFVRTVDNDQACFIVKAPA